MPRKPKPPPDDPEQFKRFIDLAHEVGADGGDPKRFDRVLDKVARSTRTATPRPDQTENMRGTKKPRVRSR